MSAPEPSLSSTAQAQFWGMAAHPGLFIQAVLAAQAKI